MREDLPESSDDVQPDDDAGLSRAERRAKARGKNPQQASFGQKGFVPKNNHSGAKRNYTNRRAG